MFHLGMESVREGPVNEDILIPTLTLGMIGNYPTTSPQHNEPRKARMVLPEVTLPSSR